ncbi:hypothetical protein KK062_26395 [Fulvivirgaceae bacterium PWU5]|uniref:Uncharacterized protein n=1 Tax=Dawidia cretensis TaxID=2782350 RepID=A0AAP2E4U5_9BACT|nr:hypothetical protein [Dawidia cretensis]MBT1711799.1 hypothetical protein [Dawidia cretensis]
MKNNSWISFVVLFILTVLVSGCRDEAQGPVTPGNVRFTIDARAVADASHGRIGAVVPAGASVYVTIADAGGHDVYTLKQINLLALAGEYVSEPLLLAPGAYTLTEFLVTDAAGNTLYATPKEGSPLAAWITDPLPASFSVGEDAITGLDVQVLAIGEYSADEFGYVTFHVDVAPFPYFRLSVFAYDSTNALVFLPVRVCILDGTDTIYKQSLPAGTQDIAFVGDPSRTYTLSLTQPSYRQHSQTFVLGELLEALDGAPLSATLTPALTFTAYGTYFYTFRLEGNVADLAIDWGDGVVEPMMTTMSGSVVHYYTDNQMLHFVSIYGDLESITALESYGYGATTEISLVNLPNLLIFAAEETRSPVYVDFRHNPRISLLSFPHSDIRSFDLPEDARLSIVGLVGNAGTSEASLSAAIRAAYRGQMTYGYEGYLYFSVMSDGTGGFVGPVTEESLAMLRELRDVHEWFIWPYEF